MQLDERTRLEFVATHAEDLLKFIAAGERTERIAFVEYLLSMLLAEVKDKKTFRQRAQLEALTRDRD